MSGGAAVAPDSITRWDLFLAVAGRPEGINVPRLAHSLFLKEEESLRRALEEMVGDRLLERQGDRYVLASQKRAQALARALSFAVAYDIDYNPFLEPEMEPVLKKAYGLDYFTQDEVPPEVLSPEVVGRLMGHDLLLVFSYKPFIGKLVDNPFLDGLCEFLGIRPNRGSLFRKKIRLENVLVEKQMASSKQQVAHARKLLGRPGLVLQGRLGLSQAGQLIKKAIVPENKELFDPAASECYRKAFERMHQRVREGRRLSVDLIREYHGAVMASTPIGGDFRDFQVQVRNNPNFRTAAPKQIPELLQKLVGDYAAVRPRGLADVLPLCAYVFNQFLFVHPFEDGNSRVARVILGHVLRENRIPFEEIPKSFEVRFLQATKGYKKRNDNDLLELLQEITLSYFNKDELDQARRGA